MLVKQSKCTVWLRLVGYLHSGVLYGRVFVKSRGVS